MSDVSKVCRFMEVLDKISEEYGMKIAGKFDIVELSSCDGGRVYAKSVEYISDQYYHEGLMIDSDGAAWTVRKQYEFNAEQDRKEIDMLKEQDQENTPNGPSRPTWKERFHEAVVEVRERSTEIYELKKEIKSHLRALDDAERERVKMAIEIDKLKYHVESLRTTRDCQAKEINRLHGLA